jgi:Bacteroidetes VLRF1 release factor
MNTSKLSFEQTIELINIKLADNTVFLECDSKKHSIIGFYNYEKVFELKLPLPFPTTNDDESLESYLNRVSGYFPPYTIVMIRADYCAIGYFENGEVLQHKALRTYMTRRKNGRNQLTYISSGGRGGTSGGQLRLQNALHFFENINETLNEWSKTTKPERIFYSCPIKMWQYLFNGKVKCFFDKKDTRLHKIPLDVGIPNFEEMMRVNKKISLGYLTVYESSSDL